MSRVSRSADPALRRLEPRARVFNQPNELPPKMSDMSIGELYQVVWKKYNHAHNLRNRFMMYWLGAPTKVHGVAAFGVYVVRLGLQAAGVTFSPRQERPLRDEYR